MGFPVIITALASFSLGGTVLYHLFQNPWTLFSWHPFCMTVAFLILTPISFGLIRERHNHKGKEAREWYVQLHGLIQVASLCLMFGGVYAIYTNKELNGKEHFTSTHSWLAGATEVLFVLTWLIAVKNTYIGANARPLWNSWNHRTLGKLAGIGLILTLASGLTSNWGIKVLGENISTYLRYAIGFLYGVNGVFGF